MKAFSLSKAIMLQFILQASSRNIKMIAIILIVLIYVTKREERRGGGGGVGGEEDEEKGGQEQLIGFFLSNLTWLPAAEALRNSANWRNGRCGGERRGEKKGNQQMCQSRAVPRFESLLSLRVKARACMRFIVTRPQ